MTTESAASTDKGLGLTLALSSLALVGAVAMLVGAMELGDVPEEIAAWGFAAAMLFATIAVAGVHVWE